MMPSPVPLAQVDLERSGDRRSENAPLGQCCRHGSWLLALALSACSLSACLLSACSPDSLSYTDTDVIVTVRDLGRSYAPYRTYALPDTVIDVCSLAVPGAGGAAGAAGAGGGPDGSAGADDTGSNEDCQPLEHDFDDDILAAIRDNLRELGFSQVSADESPDVTILPAAVAQESWYVYYPYCDYWYGYCFDYPWGPTAVSYPLGTLAMYMVASREADGATGKVPVIWLGVVSGLMSGSHELDKDRIETNIGQAFAQSAYLGEGK